MAQALKVSENAINTRTTMDDRRNEPINIAGHSPAKKVLITHVSEEEGILWQAVLDSQGISAHFEANWRIFNPNLVESLKELVSSGKTLPDMLILDMGVKLRGSDELHSGQVCHWCSKHLPGLKILLINARSENISDLSKRWGLRRGAIDVLPKLCRDNMLVSTVRVTSILGCALLAPALKNIVELMPDSLDRQFQRAFQREDNTGFDPQFDLKLNQVSQEKSKDIVDQSQTTQPLNVTLENLLSSIEPSPQSPTDQPTNLPNNILTDDDFIIYRGVKVRKKKS